MRVFLSGWGSLPEVWAPFAAAGDRIDVPPDPGDHVVAWSLGAMRALERATEVELGSLTLVAASPRFTRAPGYRHGWRLGVLDTMRERLTHDRDGLLEEFVARVFDPAPPPLTFPCDLEAGRLDEGLLYLAQFDMRERLEAITVPVRLLHGEEDLICPLGAAKELAARLPDAVLTTWPGVGHAPFLVDPERFAEWFRG